MEFFELVKKRQSVRSYIPDAVSREDIMKILDAANFAPSGQNQQQWEFIVATGKTKESWEKVTEKSGKPMHLSGMNRRKVILSIMPALMGRPGGAGGYCYCQQKSVYS
jgi:nitroreductase